MGERYLIETDYFAGLTAKALSTEQFDLFLQSLQHDCIEFEKAHKVGWQGTDGDIFVLGLRFEYRKDWAKNYTDEFIEEGDVVKVGTLVKIYPESVLKNTPPTAVIDKQANWNNQQNKQYSDKEKRDLNLLQKYLDRAEQIRKGKRQRAPRTKKSDLRIAVDYYLIDGLTQEQAEIKAVVPQGALSKGKGAEILAERVKEAHQLRKIKQDGDENKNPLQPRIQDKELEEHFVNEDLRRGEEKN